MKKILFIICILSLASCGKNGKDGAAGLPGGSTFDLTVASTGVDFADIIPGLACFNGGVSIFTFRDTNSDGVLDTDELVIKVKALCNGTNGANGVNALITLESITASETCPNGGIQFTSGASTPVEVCNGANGVNGEQGFPGIEGIPGIAGSNGTNGTNGTRVAPVKFCLTDNSTFPEYGLMVENDLFAVYWGTTPASPNKPQAFLTKLVAGNYMSTGGNNCLFTIY